MRQLRRRKSARAGPVVTRAAYGIARRKVPGESISSGPLNLTK